MTNLDETIPPTPVSQTELTPTTQSTSFAIGTNTQTMSAHPVELKINNFADFLCMIPQFSGSDADNIHDFFEKVKSIAEIAGWTDNHIVAAIKLKLTGDAATFAQFHPAIKQAKTFIKLKVELEKRFGRSDNNNTILLLTQASQKFNESTRAFLTRVSGLAYKCFPVDEDTRENLLFNQALKGLNSNTRRFIMAQSPKTFQDIWDSALKEEQCIAFDKDNAEINVAATLSNTYKNSELSEIRELLKINLKENETKISELTRQVQDLTLIVNQQTQTPNTQYRQPLLPPPPQFQHQFMPPPPPQFQQQYIPQNFQNYTRTQGPSNQKNEIICYNCNRRGHISRNCRVQQTKN